MCFGFVTKICIFALHARACAHKDISQTGMQNNKRYCQVCCLVIPIKGLSMAVNILRLSLKSGKEISLSDQSFK